MSDDLKKKMKQKIPDHPNKTMDSYSTVSIVVASKYDLSTDVNVKHVKSNGIMFRRFGDIMKPLSRNKNASSKGSLLSTLNLHE